MNKETIFQKSKPRTDKVEIPEWGLTGDNALTIREFSAGYLIELGEEKERDSKQDAERSIIASVIDENGAPIFSEEDLPALREMGAAGRIRLSRAINALNGMSPEKNG